jgi:acylphosphatase
MNTIRITVTGKVYKVGYRYYVKQMADLLEIIGNVRYAGNRKVIIEAQGKDHNLDKFITFCQLGCPGSSIKNILIKEAPDMNSKENRAMQIIDYLT